MPPPRVVVDVWASVDVTVPVSAPIPVSVSVDVSDSVAVTLFSADASENGLSWVCLFVVFGEFYRLFPRHGLT